MLVIEEFGGSKCSVASAVGGVSFFFLSDAVLLCVWMQCGVWSAIALSVSGLLRVVVLWAT